MVFSTITNVKNPRTYNTRRRGRIAKNVATISISDTKIKIITTKILVLNKYGHYKTVITKQKTLKFPNFSLTKPENLALKLVKQQQLEFSPKSVKPVIIPDYMQGVRVTRAS